jgi:hypothetical protein
MKIFSRSLLLTACVLLAASAVAQKKGGGGPPKLYRWVDENGEVHFSETIPPGFQGEDNQLEKKAGGGWAKDGALTPKPPPKRKKPKPPGKNELPRDSSGLPRPKPRFTPAQVRAQQDALLLLRYDSDKEILEAMQVEIKQLDYDRRVLNTSRKSMMQAYNGNIREAAERQRAGLKVEPKLVQNIRGLKRRLASNSRELDHLKEREASIRKSFGAELERYRTLAAAQAEADN